MRRTTARQKFLIILIVVVIILVLTYADRTTYYHDKTMNVYYHVKRNCEDIADSNDIVQHNWVYARLIDGLTPCPKCS